ncbi:MAG: SDR family oxidoreductase [Deltaproteobacteria bacterium]
MLAEVSDEELRRRAEQAARLLEAIEADRGVLAGLDRDLRVRLMAAAGRVSAPDRRAERKLRKALGKRDRAAARDKDAAALEQTGIRKKRRDAIFLTPPPDHLLQDGATEGPQVEQARSCYVCKASFDRVHFFYDQMCPPCAELNWAKRTQTADLSGRTALVTGGRVKIGYQAAIKLLRAGARVVVTTRFPCDAAERFAHEDDHADWDDRLAIYGLDLRHTPSVERFTRAFLEREPRLDFLLNNACQTVRRPAGFYRHLIEGETTEALPATVASRALTPVADALTSAMLTQVPLLPEDLETVAYPLGALDQDLQQVDLRETNSWRLRLDEVETLELFEVFLVNAVAPFVLNARLKPAMLRVASRDKHIVNVSAMEGQFYRVFKTDKHPHTNMAKAALNMMTRTSAPDYLKDGIHMNSVDTGWVTDEDPAAIAERKAAEGFTPPLDIVDGAARICDPIFVGMNTQEHVWGQFLKDYRPVAW